MHPTDPDPATLACSHKKNVITTQVSGDEREDEHQRGAGIRPAGRVHPGENQCSGRLSQPSDLHITRASVVILNYLQTICTNQLRFFTTFLLRYCVRFDQQWYGHRNILSPPL
jgi:hypothetical protein